MARRPLFSEPALLTPTTPRLICAQLNQFSGINTIIYYSGLIFAQLYSQESAIWLACGCDGAQLLGVCISLYTIDSQGRRLTALRSCALVTVSLTVVRRVARGRDPSLLCPNLLLPLTQQSGA